MAEFSELIVLSISDLEDNLGAAQFRRFVERSEQRFVDQVTHVADYILSNPSIRAIFVSGPTSSGKTTSSKLMTKRLTEAGLRTWHLEMDDYYRTEDLLYDEDGRPDYESIETLDLQQFSEDLQRILNHENVPIPTFDFKTRTRRYDPGKAICLEKNDVVLMEGLHGISEQVTSKLPREQQLSYFIMPHARVLSDARMLSGSDIRVLRRISRDVRHRGATALDTIDYWPVIERAESAFIPVYLKAADFYINSVLPYEFMVVAPMAYREIEKSLDLFFNRKLPPSSYSSNPAGHSDLKRAIKEASRLSWVCEQIPAVTPSFVPENSILQEFIR